MRDVPNTNEIGAYLHCRKCIDELPPDESPRNYARLEVGWTKLGIQVWCKRHDCNVCHIDFEGARHQANTRSDEIIGRN
jgi:hypothetical protein